MEEEKLLEEMNGFVSETDISSGTDDDGLPFEPIDAFSTDPVSFFEMSERMTGKVENLFDLTRLYNRHSAKYLKACTLLERGIKRLGSLCVTKYALEENDGVRYPELKELTTQKLYRMASFNYRKLDTALTEKLEKGNDLYTELTEMVFRYFHLLQRLRATERNIHTYFNKRYYGETDYKPIVEGIAFSEKSWTRHFTSEKEEAPVFRAAPAFPILKKELKAEAAVSDAPAADTPLLPAPEGKKTAPAAEPPAPQAEAPLSGKNTEGTGTVAKAEAPAVPGIRDEGRPAWFGIVQNAILHSPEAGNGYISFTEDEILALDTYPDLEPVFPDLAEIVKKAAAKIRSRDPGTAGR